jgi:hypothetical protein
MDLTIMDRFGVACHRVPALLLTAALLPLPLFEVNQLRRHERDIE